MSLRSNNRPWVALSLSSLLALGLFGCHRTSEAPRDGHSAGGDDGEHPDERGGAGPRDERKPREVVPPLPIAPP